MSFTKKQVIQAFSWDFLGKFTKRFATFFIGIILARLLSPEEFGIVGLATVFVTIIGSLTNMGLGAALIQKKDASPTQFDSAFFVNILVSLCLATAAFASAPLVADFYELPELEGVLHWLSLSILIQGFTLVQAAYLRKSMSFKYLSIAQVIANVIAGLAGVAMAFFGYGVWSLVVRSLVSAGLNSGLMWSFSPWKPSFRFSFNAIKELSRYSSHMYLSSLLNLVFEKLDNLIVGKLFNAYDLGLFVRAKSLNVFIIEFASKSLASVSFPYLSGIQDDNQKLVSQSLRITNLVGFSTFALLGMLYLISEPLIVTLIGEKWLPSVRLFELLCLSGYAHPISAATLSMMRAKGESASFLKLEVVKKINHVLAFVVGFQFGLEGYIIAFAVIALIGTILNMIYSGRPVGLGLWPQLKNLQSSFLISISLVLVFSLMPLDQLSYWMQLAIIPAGFMGSYLLVNWAFRTEGLNFILTQIRPKLKRFGRSKK